MSSRKLPGRSRFPFGVGSASQRASCSLFYKDFACHCEEQNLHLKDFLRLSQLISPASKRSRLSVFVQQGASKMSNGNHEALLGDSGQVLHLVHHLAARIDLSIP